MIFITSVFHSPSLAWKYLLASFFDRYCQYGFWLCSLVTLFCVEIHRNSKCCHRLHLPRTPSPCFQPLVPRIGRHCGHCPIQPAFGQTCLHGFQVLGPSTVQLTPSFGVQFPSSQTMPFNTSLNKGRLVIKAHNLHR